MSQLQVRLYRDSFNTPWGFRLQGGKDLGQPLSIQRVFSNSPAEGELQRGDLILSINNRDGTELTHKQALDLIKHGGGQIQLVIQRPAPGRVQSTASVTIKPQRPRAPSLQQPPPSNMPATGYGFQPKKVTLSSLGGGGPQFGSDFSSYRPSVTQPVQVHTGGRAPPGHNADMLNRVQESLDNISLSPRTPDYYQAPPFSPTSPGGGGGYVPTGVRLDMERDAEERRRQQQLQQQQQQQQQKQQQYQQQPSLSYEPPPPSAYYEPRPTGYVPTAVRLEQQQKGEEDVDETGQPVKERRRQFLNTTRPAPALSGKSSAPKVLKPKAGSSGFTFGVDYSKPQPKTSSVTWKPQAAQRPVNVPPPQRQPTTPVQHAAPPPPPTTTTWSHEDDQQPQAPPAWRTSLKTTGVKPWDKDLEYTAGQQQAPRSVAFQPPAAAPFSPVPLTPGGGPQQDGPQVVHLQYNSPMGLYSRENVQETFAGQTKAMVAGGPPSSGGPPPVQNPAKPGDRDWTQSAVYRMIYEEEHKGQRSAPQQQQQQQQQKQPAGPQQPQYKAPPPAAPKPQHPTFQQSFQPLEDEFGTSDF